MTVMTTPAAPAAQQSEAAPLPVPRGDISAWVVDVIAGATSPSALAPAVGEVAVGDEDHALALYVLYELHYRGFGPGSEDLEWDADLLRFRADLERVFLDSVRDEVGPVHDAGDVVDDLQALFDADTPSLSGWCEEQGEYWHLAEQAVQRSAYQLKEADPHSWALPRLHGEPKAALVRLQYDEYGEGVTNDAHAALFALHLDRMGLDSTYGAWIDWIPGSTLATTNLVSLFGLHRRWRGALVGHLAMFEMASVPVMAAYSAALKRLGYDAWTRLFYDVHVAADASHQTVASRDLAGGLVRQTPELAHDVMFGAQALAALERLVTCKSLAAWSVEASSLLKELPSGAESAPGLVEDRLPGDDPRADRMP